MKNSDKKALITGGTGALGRVIVKRFLGEGVKVASSYRDEAEMALLRNSFGDEVVLIPGDVTQESDVKALFDRAVDAVQRIDILLNVVGGYVPGSSVKDTETQTWDLMMSLNLRSMFLCSREFLRRAHGASYGRIISIGAMPALQPSAGMAAYGVSKAGVISLTEFLGLELKGTGITANAIAPSILDTPANRHSMPAGDPTRWVSPDEIAELMLFLCSDQGKSINGVCIPVFGGS